MYVFPKWTNRIRPTVGLLILTVPVYVAVVFALAASPKTTDVGYQPTQPVPYFHSMHVGNLGMDCRYCHWPVEHEAHATIPPTEVCMNCHATIKNQSDKLVKIVAGNKTGLPVEWIRVHDLPGYVYFDHSAHVTRGVSCVSCHGRVDTMDVVYQQEPLSMGWCLDCHRDPVPHLRPVESVYDLTWQPPDGKTAEEVGRQVRDEFNINPPTDCSTCHR